MIPARYLHFGNGHHGSLSRIGGQPSLLPPSFPWGHQDDAYIGYSLQLAHDPIWLPIPDCAYLQLWQPIDPGDDPMPYAVVVPSTAKVNAQGDVQVVPNRASDIVLGDIMQDPEHTELESPQTLEKAHLFLSKLGGLDPWNDDIPRGKFLGQLSEGKSGLNFGGTMCSIYLMDSGEVRLLLR